MASDIVLKNNLDTELRITHINDKPAKSLDSNDLTYTRATVVDMEAISNPQDGDVCFVKDLDRGGSFIYDSSEVANDNQGTNFNGWIRQYSGSVNVKWFGAKSITEAGYESYDSTSSIQNVINNYSSVYIPEGTYSVTTLSVTNKNPFILYGDGLSISVIDFKGGTNGLYIHETSSVGGVLNVFISDISFTDSSSSSIITNLINIRGGNAGLSPSETSGYVCLSNVGVIRYKSLGGTAIKLTNLSHVNISNCFLPYDCDCKYGLYINNDVLINTGVISVKNSYFTSGETALYIGGIELMDTFDITGNFFGNRIGVLNQAADTIVFDGSSSPISSINFLSNHIECGGDSSYSALKCIGKVWATTILSNHFSANVGISAFAIQFSSSSPRCITIENNEFLNYPSFTTNGAIIRFENDCTCDVEEPIRIGANKKNIGNPYVVLVETGGNEDNIWSGILASPSIINRVISFESSNQVKSFIPPFSEGMISFSINNLPSHSGTIIFRAEGGGASCISIGGGTSFTVGTGIPTGTTSPSGTFGVYTNTDGKIYLENRIGYTVNCFISPITFQVVGN